MNDGIDLVEGSHVKVSILYIIKHNEQLSGIKMNRKEKYFMNVSFIAIEVKRGS